MDKEYSLRELAEEAKVPERTIRFYISRGILEPPLRGGRGAAYGPQHRARLEKIKKLQSRGMMLSEIAHSFAAERIGGALTDPLGASACPAAALPDPDVWKSFRIDDDVVVMLRAGASPWRMKRLISELQRFAAQVKEDHDKDKDN